MIIEKLKKRKIRNKIGLSALLGIIVGAIFFVIGSVTVITSIFEMDKLMGNIGIFLYILGFVLIGIGIILGLIWIVVKLSK